MRICLYVLTALLHRDYYIQLLSFRMKIAEMKTSQGITNMQSQRNRCSISLHEKQYASAAGYSEPEVVHSAHCLNQRWDDLGAAHRHTPFSFSAGNMKKVCTVCLVMISDPRI